MLSAIIFGIIVVSVVIALIVINARSKDENSDIKSSDNSIETDVMDAEPVSESTDEISGEEYYESIVAIAPEPVKQDHRTATTDKIIKKDKDESFITDDEVRFRAYMIASADNFKGDAREYWIQAEKELRGKK